MIRRDPTRIELTLDDIQEYHIRVKREADAKRAAAKGINPINALDVSITGFSEGSAAGTNAPVAKTRVENVHERIGFNPTPRNP